jgi:hypothetical protein
MSHVHITPDNESKIDIYLQTYTHAHTHIHAYIQPWHKSTSPTRTFNRHTKAIISCSPLLMTLFLLRCEYICMHIYVHTSQLQMPMITLSLFIQPNNRHRRWPAHKTHATKAKKYKEHEVCLRIIPYLSPKKTNSEYIWTRLRMKKQIFTYVRFLICDTDWSNNHENTRNSWLSTPQTEAIIISKHKNTQSTLFVYNSDCSKDCAWIRGLIHVRLRVKQ